MWIDNVMTEKKKTFGGTVSITYIYRLRPNLAQSPQNPMTSLFFFFSFFLLCIPARRLPHLNRSLGPCRQQAGLLVVIGQGVDHALSPRPPSRLLRAGMVQRVYKVSLGMCKQKKIKGLYYKIYCVVFQSIWPNLLTSTRSQKHTLPSSEPLTTCASSYERLLSSL